MARNLKKTIKVSYDKEGDVLELRTGEPTPAYCEEIEEGVFQRRDEKTHQIRGSILFSVKKRMQQGEHLNLTVPLEYEQ